MLKYPLVKVVIPFIIGIILQYAFSINPVILIILSACGIITSVIFYGINVEKLTSLSSMILLFTIISLSAVYFALSSANKTTYPFKQTRYTHALVYGKVKQISLPDGSDFKLVIKTDSVKVGNETKLIGINLLTRVFPKTKNDSIYNSLHPGNYITIEGTIKRGRGKRNPGEYDYQKYLESVDISALLDVYDSYPKILDSHISYAADIIHQVRKRINSSIITLHNEETAALLKGLLLADRTSLDYELKESFVNAGVVHVLAVSGLHVGYILLIFLILFNRANIILRYVFTIIGLLFFLLITGSPPSVFRATIMAIILLLSGLSSRQYNAVNSLSLAALILLIIDPAELFMPGFQLSFSAVLSILLIYPVIKREVDVRMQLPGFIKNYSFRTAGNNAFYFVLFWQTFSCLNSCKSDCNSAYRFNCCKWYFHFGYFCYYHSCCGNLCISD